MEFGKKVEIFWNATRSTNPIISEIAAEAFSMCHGMVFLSNDFLNHFIGFFESLSACSSSCEFHTACGFCYENDMATPLGFKPFTGRR